MGGANFAPPKFIKKEVDMKLNTAERINLISMCKSWSIDAKTDFTSMKVMNDFMGDLGFSQDEIDDLQFEVKKNGTSWNRDKDKPKEIKVVDRVKEVIRGELAKYDKAKQLNFLKHFSLCEKFEYQPAEAEPKVKEAEIVKEKKKK